MIKYNFTCGNKHRFSSWFKSSDIYKQLSHISGSIVCPICASTSVYKEFNIPSKISSTQGDKVKGRKISTDVDNKSNDVEKITKFMQQYRKYVESNFEYVGTDLKYIALESHKMQQREASLSEDESDIKGIKSKLLLAKKQGVYGEISLSDAEELIDKGVNLLPFPEHPSKKAN